MISEAAVQSLKSRPEWQELAAHIQSCIRDYDRVSDIELTDKDAIAIETVGRKRGIEICKAILEPFGFSTQQPSNRKEHSREKFGLS